MKKQPKPDYILVKKEGKDRLKPCSLPIQSPCESYRLRKGNIEICEGCLFEACSILSQNGYKREGTD